MRWVSIFPASRLRLSCLRVAVFSFCFRLTLPRRRASTRPFAGRSRSLQARLRVFIGTDTSKGVSKGIYHATFNARNGQLSVPHSRRRDTSTFLSRTLPAQGRPTFSLRGKRHTRPVGDSHHLRSGPEDRNPDAKGKVTSAGAGPAYVSVDSTGNAAFVADYYGGAIASYRIQPDGTLSEPVSTFNYKDPEVWPSWTGSSDVRMAPIRTPSSSHPTIASSSSRDLGNDALSVFQIDTATAKLTPGTPLLTNLRPGSGPRHIAFHPNGRWIYPINELDSTLDHLLWTATHSATHPQDFWSTPTPRSRPSLLDFPREKHRR